MKIYRTAMIFAFMLITLLSACQSPGMGPNIQSPVKTKVLTSTPTSTATPSPVPSATQLPTVTPSPTPTVTPTVSLPVGPGNPVPIPAEPISASNVSNLVQIARYQPVSASDQLISFSPDRSVMAIGSNDGVDLYNADTLLPLGRLNAPLKKLEDAYFPRMLQLSNNGERILITGIGNQTVYNQDGSVQFTYNDPFIGYENAILSPDGKLLAVEFCSICTKENSDYADQGKFIIYNLESKESVYQYGNGQGGEARGRLYPFSPDGRYLSTLIGSEIYLWDTTSWKLSFSLPIGTYKCHEMSRVQFSPDSRYIAINSDDNIAVWSLDGRELIGRYGSNIYWRNYVLFSPDSLKIAYVSINGSSDGTTSAVVFNIIGGEQSGLIRDLKDPYYALRLDNDGQVAAVHLPPKSGNPVPPWQELRYPRDLRFTTLAGKTGIDILSTYGDTYCRIEIEDGSGTCSQQYLVPASDGSYVQVMIEKGLVSLAKVEDELIFTTFTWSGMSISIEAIDLKNKFVFYEEWATPNYATAYMAEYTENSQKILSQWSDMWFGSQIAFDSSGNKVAFTLQKNPGALFYIYDIGLRQLLLQTDFSWSNSSIAFSPDGNYVVNLGLKVGEADSSGIVNLFQLEDYFKIRDLPTSGSEGNSPYLLALSPTSPILAVRYRDGTIHILDLNNGNILKQLAVSSVSVIGFPQMAFSPDGKMLAVLGDDSVLMIWGVMP